VSAYAAGDEPDEAEVTELADTIHRTYCEDGCGFSPTLGDRNAARAALKWIRGKQQRGGNADA
jgi:hypothetical protein